MKAILLIVCFLLLYIQTVSGQQEYEVRKDHFFSVNTGLNRLKEENLILKVHSGTINTFTYRFEKYGQNYQEVFLTLGYSKLKTKLEQEKVTQNEQISFGYSICFHMLKKENPDYSLGFNIRYTHALVEFPVWDESRAYWGTSLSFGPSNRLVINIKEKRSWISSWDINFLGFYSRPDEERLYAQENWSLFNIMKTTNSNLKFGLINNILINNFRTEYVFHLNKEQFISFMYSISSSGICKNKEHPLLINTSSIGIGIGF
jgi:hypothetical protein